MKNSSFVLSDSAPTRAARFAGLGGVASVLLGCSAMALAAQVRIPVPGTDVPVTLQSLMMLLVGFALPPGRAAAAMVLYVMLGSAGLPVFAPQSLGLSGPTGGFIAGFVPGAWLVSRVKGEGHAGIARLALAGIAGLSVLFVMGVGWRVAWFHSDFTTAVTTGFVPFAAKAVVELLLAVTAVVSVRGLGRVRAGRVTG